MSFAYNIDLASKRGGRSTFKRDKEIYLSFIFIATSIITDIVLGLLSFVCMYSEGFLFLFIR
jgi:hypothetical protein